MSTTITVHVYLKDNRIKAHKWVSPLYPSLANQEYLPRYISAHTTRKLRDRFRGRNFENTLILCAKHDVPAHISSPCRHRKFWYKHRQPPLRYTIEDCHAFLF